MSGRRLPVRWRLTIVYGSLFFLAASVLVIINYLVLDRIVNQRFAIKITPEIVGTIPKPTLPMPTDSPANRLFLFQSVVEGEVDRYKELVSGSMMQWSIIASVLIGVAGLVVGWVVAQRALAPLLTMTETARRLSGSTLHQRIALDGPRDEIKDLADTFDSMLERLHHAFDSQRRFVANASHELKTPIAINRALLQVGFADPLIPAALRPVRDELLAANTRQEQLIEGLLTLAQSERELTTREDVDLRDLAQPAILAHHLPADPADRRPAPCSGDAVLLERMITNLVDNAVKYNDERGLVVVRTGADHRGVFVLVDNTGRVIADAQAARLFEPFRRLEADRTGSAGGAGLGLSIVRAVAHAHGGTAVAAPRPGGGLRVTVRLPRRRPRLSGQAQDLGEATVLTSGTTIRPVGDNPLSVFSAKFSRAPDRA